MEYLVTFFFLVAAHYFDYDNLLPWRMPHPVRILLNYVIGTVGMLAPFGWKLYEMGETELLLSMCGFVLAAGFAPMLCYVNDGLKVLRQRAQEQAELAQAYKGQRDEQAGRQ